MTVTDIGAAAKARLAERMIPVATDLAMAVREEDACLLALRLGRLTKQELFALAVTLAAMVPVDEPVGDLLAWADWGEDATAILAAADAPLPLDGKAADYAELIADGVSRKDAAARLQVKVCTTYGYDDKIRKAQEESAA